MILPNGRFCLIRDKFVTADGALVLHAEYWLDQADHDERPEDPRAAHDHLFHVVGPPLTEANADLTDRIVAKFQQALDANGNGRHAVRTDHVRGTDDKQGWLAHSHVKALGVTKREQ